MDVPLSCYACGTTAALADGARCDCGEPYWVQTDPSTFEWPDTSERSLWRYRALLPDVTPAGLAAGAGGTPLVRAPRLDDDVGATVHVKYEGANPTGTFKDRGSAVGVAAGAAAGDDAVGTVSHGNMARSMAAHAASAGLDCLVLVPADIPVERLALLARYDPTILRVEGDYGRLYRESLRVGSEAGVRFVNSDTPLRVAGQGTTALEIAESFAPDVPDAVVLPVSSGGHASGVWKAFRDLSAADLVDRVPRLYFVQTSACAPIAEAWARRDDVVTPVEAGETVAYSIANADPPSGNRVLAAASETDGGVLAVDDDAILDARRALASSAGLFVESACATVLAGARRLHDRGDLVADDDVVLVATGTGFTERDLDAPGVDAETVPLSALDETVARII
ncbi:threonine synthase [Haloarcula pellucida]|uniref:Threonine synthase n=1 Tax=Haloarcula pellucida TaxID=1427151 RepID=A0A830GM98_9EURY|nr:threonine synthase [Halomicroarcula pellucida]MBX0348338.1 threonine synthase [Halomicroarcula pellucida]GGN98072.1 threonine synthase [Halomicroarcula pellucida]